MKRTLKRELKVSEIVNGEAVAMKRPWLIPTVRRRASSNRVVKATFYGSIIEILPYNFNLWG